MRRRACLARGGLAEQLGRLGPGAAASHHSATNARRVRRVGPVWWQEELPPSWRTAAQSMSAVDYGNPGYALQRNCDESSKDFCVVDSDNDPGESLGPLGPPGPPRPADSLAAHESLA